MLAYLGFSQSILGPLMPFLRSELRLNFTLGGFLPATLAIGLILSGVIGASLARHWSRRVVFWGGAIGLGIGVILLTLSRRFELALAAVLGMGICSSLTQVMIQAILADHHAERRAIALTEANVAASFSATLTPLVIGSLQGMEIGWRAISVLVILLLAILACSFFRQDIPDRAPVTVTSAKENGGLPMSFWLYWIVLLFVVAIEMSVVVWATDFLDLVAGLGRTNAVLAFSAFPAAMLTGRIVGSRLTRHWASLTLLMVALGVTLVGFPLFWLSRTPLLNIVGLFITGLGIANMYPLTIAIAIGLAGSRSNEASARFSLCVGIALFCAPLMLGWLADRLNLETAYAIVVVLTLAACIIVLSNRRNSSQAVPSLLSGRVD